jgi:hypothetical protein
LEIVTLELPEKEKSTALMVVLRTLTCELLPETERVEFTRKLVNPEREPVTFDSVNEISPMVEFVECTVELSLTTNSDTELLTKEA